MMIMTDNFLFISGEWLLDTEFQNPFLSWRQIELNTVSKICKFILCFKHWDLKVIEKLHAVL
jgi:hypothetical protein